MPKILILCLAHHTHNKDIQKNGHTQRHMDTDIVPFSHFALFVSYLYAKDTNFVFGTPQIYTCTDTQTHAHTYSETPAHTDTYKVHMQTYTHVSIFVHIHKNTRAHSCACGKSKEIVASNPLLSQIWQKLLL